MATAERTAEKRTNFGKITRRDFLRVGFAALLSSLPAVQTASTLINSPAESETSEESRNIDHSRSVYSHANERENNLTPVTLKNGDLITWKWNDPGGFEAVFKVDVSLEPDLNFGATIVPEHVREQGTAIWGYSSLVPITGDMEFHTEEVRGLQINGKPVVCRAETFSPRQMSDCFLQN
ncbi:hypothetical protein A2630_00295 [Candidatus Woesebacteria bacterium RIFCSPHIGHO2_01_FULL_44_10]|uniref:Uncharacterized protein n=1 Tax=Candidatus Woesebacteria bacterium RIFCSPLOWO2_01_FULL_44_14 TaxID=1802525 RepID=A0A1F8BXB7_9BACT|nr:MAG: hypothetical protein A2630_00295 [Candidatus Woesebacteria bacterium RIFCSPHIGHO2_01_FULL_44_10]OGM55795.1 MAG: hypothetical protein A3F62_04190 [Candidatus Woesebacteria bacterium RIFCSPHIGHO2_12_FULL_44_11]OGM68743.1 MAG: hypothetical protein A2975_05595 [Candidatus Woesebacteria bacterium RIFCSPLOWO2_01_FULL_44_14]